MIQPGRPPGRRGGHAAPLQVIDGDTIGPDGRPLSAFARFAERIKSPAGVEVSVALLLGDGSILLAGAEGPPRRVHADGTVEALSCVEVPDGQ